jgi:hypothetical protein
MECVEAGQQVGVKVEEQEMGWKMDEVDEVLEHDACISISFLISYEPPSQFCIFVFLLLPFLLLLSYPSTLLFFLIGVDC